MFFTKGTFLSFAIIFLFPAVSFSQTLEGSYNSCGDLLGDTSNHIFLNSDVLDCCRYIVDDIDYCIGVYGLMGEDEDIAPDFGLPFFGEPFGSRDHTPPLRAIDGTKGGEVTGLPEPLPPQLPIELLDELLRSFDH